MSDRQTQTGFNGETYLESDEIILRISAPIILFEPFVVLA
jgi:hypothetical protein